jgi:hypothetical protein
VSHLDENLATMIYSCSERANDVRRAQNNGGNLRSELEMRPRFGQFRAFRLEISGEEEDG